MYVEDIQYFEFGHGIHFTGLSFQFSRWCLDVLFLEIDIKKNPKNDKNIWNHFSSGNECLKCIQSPGGS